MPPKKLNFQQRVMATPLKLAGSEVDRAHQSVYFIMETLNKYQKTFLEREYHKFWYSPSAVEACQRLDEEMKKIKMYVGSSVLNKYLIVNQHFVIYEYLSKLYLAPRLIYRYKSLFKRLSKGAPVLGHIDTASTLICPHALARLMQRSGLEWDEAIRTMGLLVLSDAKNQITRTGDLNRDLNNELFPFAKDQQVLEKIVINGVGEMRSEGIQLEAPLYCDGEQVLPTGKTLNLFKTWISY